MILTQQEALKKLQSTEFEILLSLAEFCQDNNITWFLDSGSCLGALRHQGFIPWDDDIDVGMMRADYDRFIELAKDGLPNGCSLHTARNTKGFAPLFAKVFKDGTRFETAETRSAGLAQGIFIDIFPFDFLYEDESLRTRQIETSRVAQRESYLYHSSAIRVPDKGIKGAIERLGCKVVHAGMKLSVRNPEKYQDMYDSCIPNENTGAVSKQCRSFSYSMRVIFEADDLVPPAHAIFEGHELPVPAKAETYLTKVYGDWQQIPSPGNQRTHLPLLLDFGDGTIWQVTEA